MIEVGGRPTTVCTRVGQLRFANTPQGDYHVAVVRASGGQGAVGRLGTVGQAGGSAGHGRSSSRWVACGAEAQS